MGHDDRIPDELNTRVVDPSVWDTWLRDITNVAANRPWMPTVGQPRDGARLRQPRLREHGEPLLAPRQRRRTPRRRPDGDLRVRLRQRARHLARRQRRQLRDPRQPRVHGGASRTPGWRSGSARPAPPGAASTGSSSATTSAATAPTSCTAPTRACAIGGTTLFAAHHGRPRHQRPQPLLRAGSPGARRAARAPSPW